VTIFHCLRLETSLFVASYDSQGNGGGIRSRLHTASDGEGIRTRLLKLPCGPHRRHQVEQLIVLCCPVGCQENLVYSSCFAAIRCNGNVISESLLSKGRLALAPLFRLSAVTSRYIQIVYQYFLYSLKYSKERNLKIC
jgi:hypothetical protein